MPWFLVDMNPCHCGNLAKFAKDPEIPIQFTNKSGSYFVYLTSTNQQKLSFCFVCGGHSAQREEPKCKCKQLRKWSDVRGSCIQHDAVLNEYHLVYGDRCRLFLYYCPKCGGRLPESKSNRVSGKSFKVERLKFEKKLERAKTLEQVIKVLGGPPDERDTDIRFDKKEKEIYGAKPVKELIRYTQIARTLNIVAQELEDGTLQIFYPMKSKS
ncbi:MAG: hypothetical protein KIS67_28845 [Verrucomicrobiae bacterium]|nr:hypothetical protein [Verrucomicrobiae bacterium]